MQKLTRNWDKLRWTQQRAIVESSLKKNGKGPLRDSRRRQRLWAEQEGKCCYCGRMTILPAELLKEYALLLEKEYLVKFLLASGRDTMGNLIDHLLRNVPEFKDRWHDDLATLEHVIPRGSGGEDTMANLALACARCNAERGVTTHKEWLAQQALYNPKARRFKKLGWVWSEEEEKWVDLTEGSADEMGRWDDNGGSPT